MAKVHIHWRYVLDDVSKHMEDLSFERLATITMGPHNEPADDLAVKFEATIVDELPIFLEKNRVQLSGGQLEECNGFTMWQRPNREYKRTGDAVEYAGNEALRKYGRREKLRDLSRHMDGWLDLLNRYGSKLPEAAPAIVRRMLLDIIPKDMKPNIMANKKFQEYDHLEMIEHVRHKCDVQLKESLVDVAKKNLAEEYSIRASKRINAINEAATTLVPDDGNEGLSTSKNLINAVKELTLTVNAPKSPPRPKPQAGATGRRDLDRGKNTSSQKGSPRRNPSPGRDLVPNWGKTCNQCGSESHQKKDCKELNDMMAKANVGVPKGKWTPPKGYKRALGKVRGALKTKWLKEKGGR